MVISIKIENQFDFQWLLPFIEALKKNTTTKIEIQSASTTSEKSWEEKLNSFFRHIDTHAVRVEKIELLSRDELNER